ncbi:hypothetical protein CaCOL14_011442 [Colletotrichum acutatum]|uniref:S-adenosyl-L-methionine-dependent methyltransferase n=1 Tax=Glomerella acutata TaxID=27357 RepID=A0AAD8UM96_GLOAC|nr:S-adenosyl-L-methionine-dependent methyltransferase [Colletotrichum acutatum]KAK1723941.1 S-adenosyl-L-methionine-dependent methyltransferase [Colletotrichum acutatum]
MSNAETARPVAAGPVIVAEEREWDDSSSDHGSSFASSTTSLNSSIFQHRLENGRTYHKYKDGKYHWPNDEKESDRLDLQHNLFLLTFHFKLGLAPPSAQDSGVKRVLDVGTGTGLWAIEFADEHPEAEVYGVDLSPVQTSAVPPNAKFEVDDIEEPWTYHVPFDYIHTRMMTSSVSDWSKLFKQAFKHLEPGGYLEIQEADLHPHCDDGTLKPDHAMTKWLKLLGEAMEIFGRPFVDIPGLVAVMEEVGFVDVTIETYKWPINEWPKDSHYKEIGTWTHANFMEGLEAWTLAPYTRALNWTKEEVFVFLAEVRSNLKNRNIHAYWPIYSIYGRKPGEKKKTTATEEPATQE